VHGAYFDEPKCYALMRDLLRSLDRCVLLAKDDSPPALPKAQGIATT
jgi:hypothetical protein